MELTRLPRCSIGEPTSRGEGWTPTGSPWGAADALNQRRAKPRGTTAKLVELASRGCGRKEPKGGGGWTGRQLGARRNNHNPPMRRLGQAAACLWRRRR